MRTFARNCKYVSWILLFILLELKLLTLYKKVMESLDFSYLIFSFDKFLLQISFNMEWDLMWCHDEPRNLRAQKKHRKLQNQ